MKKIFTLAFAALAATSAFAQDDVQNRLQIVGPYVNVPENVNVIFDAADQLGDLGDKNKYQLYIWENTLSISAGMDDVVGEYQNFVCGGLGWAGCGLNIAKKSEAPNVVPFPAKEMDDSWRLHFMWKNDMPCNFALQVGPNIGNVQGEFVFKNGNGNDGSWQTVDVPVTDLLDQYVNTDEETAYIMFFRNWTDVNLYGAVVTDGTVNGGNFAICDMYYYKNGTLSVKGIEANGNVVAQEYYTFDGKKLAEAPQQGLYLVKKTFENGAVKTEKVAK